MQGTVILPCNCKHEEQDKIYGKGNRLHNIGGKDKDKQEAYCTVCSPSFRREKQGNDALKENGKPFGQTVSIYKRPLSRRGKPFKQRD